MNTIDFVFSSAPIRSIELNGIKYFVAMDVMKALGYRDTNASSKLAKISPNKSVYADFADESGAIQEFRVIDEKDVYRLIIRSSMSSADLYRERVIAALM
jgi:prophage antirepressor-like protein